MKNNFTKYACACSFFLLLGLTGCDEMLDVELPSNEFSSSTVYASDVTAEGAVNGIYQSMVTSTYNNYLHTTLGETSDELIQRSQLANVYVSNEMVETDGTAIAMWTEFYRTIYNANSVIEGVSASSNLNQVRSREWIAEAKFLRAFCYLYMTNLWGDVPLILTTNVDQSALAPRSPQAEIYTQIVLDLTQAASELPSNYSSYNGTRIRATRWAAETLLARVNLYQGNWTEASSYADSVINQTGTYRIITGLTASNSPFVTNSEEAIWQIPYFNFDYTYEGSSLFTDAGRYLLRKGSTLFEAGDARRTNWTIDVTNENGSFAGTAPKKYTNSFDGTVLESSTVLRLAELYLIRAEARVRLNNITGAQQDINVIRNRALVSPTTLTDPAQLLALISLEREREFFAEFGHRWFDLKRSGTINQVLGSIQGKVWTPTDQFFPIPESAIRSNPFLTQNSGY